MSELEMQTEETAAPSGAVNVSETSESPKTNGTVATGGELPPEPESKPYWPEDWRQKAAEHVAAGDAKLTAKELKRLEKISDPSSLYASYRAIENTWASRNFVKLPGKDATPEDIAEYHKALGVPETPEDYFKNLQLDNGMVLGEADKPVAAEFANAMHKAGATPTQMKAALEWYLRHEEEQAAALDESDDTFRRVSEQALKNEFGNAFKRYTNNISSLFATAPGGSDVSNENSVYARLMGGRTADGSLIGNDPDVVRWLVSLSNNLNPIGAVVEDGDQKGVSLDNEISSLETRMREDRKGYFKDEKAQARYRELLSARDKIRARAR